MEVENKMTKEKFKPAGREKIDTKKWKCINEHSGDGKEMVMCFGKNKMLSFFDDGRIRFSKEKGNVKVLIWADDCFGACDYPIIKTVDLLVQFGHSSPLIAKPLV